MPAYYNVLSEYYSKQDGPYLLGDRVTYADFAVYQSIDNDGKTGTLPVSIVLWQYSLIKIETDSAGDLGNITTCDYEIQRSI